MCYAYLLDDVNSVAAELSGATASILRLPRRVHYLQRSVLDSRCPDFTRLSWSLKQTDSQLE